MTDFSLNSQPIMVAPIATFGNVWYWREMIQFAAQNPEGQILLELHENYQKQSFRNRYEIDGANGKMALTVPVIGQKGEKTPISEIKIDDSEKWQTLHWRALCATYNHSPFFEFYQDDLLVLFEKKYTFLKDFNLASHQFLIDNLEISLNISHSEKYIEYGTAEKDLRVNFKSSKMPQDLFRYYQVFEERNGFLSALSGLDLLFNLGPESLRVLRA